MSGYWLRVAEANGYESARQLRVAVLSESMLYEKLRLADDEQLRLFGNLKPDWNKPSDANGLSDTDFNHNYLRWCPLCLMDSPHIHGVWTLKLWCVCIEHKVYLHECCAGCGERQSLGRAMYNRCQCGVRLTAGTIRSAPAALLNITVILGKSIEIGKSEFDFMRLTFPQWRKLILYFGQFTEHSQPTKPGKVSNLCHLAVSTNLVTNIAYLVEKWPNNFHRLLWAIHKQHGESHSLKRTFGKLMYVLYKHLDDQVFQFLRDAFETYIEGHWEGLIGKRNQSLKLEAITKHPRITVKKAAELSVTSPAFIRLLIHGDLVGSHSSRSIKGRRNYSVHIDEIKNIVALSKNNLSLQEAAKMLALPEQRVRTLLAAGVLKPLLPHKETNAARWYISRKEVANLFVKPNLTDTTEKTVTVSGILKYWRLSDNEFIAMIDEVKMQNFRLVSDLNTETAIGKLMLIESEFRAWLHGLRSASTGTMSVDAAAKVLKIKQQVAYQLVYSGILGSKGDEQDGIRVSFDDIASFKKNYISLADVAQNYGKSPRTILLQLAAKPVTGPKVDGNRQYFYRWDYISELLD